MNRKLHLLYYALKNCLQQMLRHWTLCLSSIGAVSLALALIGLFVLGGYHIQAFSSDISKTLSIHVILQDNIDANQAQSEIQKQLESMENISSVQFSDKDAELEKMIAEKGEVFSQYRGENNPLANAFFVNLADESLLEQTAARLKKLPGVSEVAFGGNSASELVSFLEIVRWVTFILALLLLSLAFYMVYSAIRASISLRTPEIWTMRTVGASDWFIRIPFIVEGLILGVLGALVDYIALGWAYESVYTAMQGHLFLQSLQMMNPSAAWMALAWSLFGCGALCGLMAPLAAIHKDLKLSR